MKAMDMYKAINRDAENDGVAIAIVEGNRYYISYSDNNVNNFLASHKEAKEIRIETLGGRELKTYTNLEEYVLNGKVLEMLEEEMYEIIAKEEEMVARMEYRGEM